MVYRKTPYSHLRNLTQKWKAITSEEEIICPDVGLEAQDVDVVDVMIKCLKKNPKERISIEDLFIHPYLKKGPSTKPSTSNIGDMISAASLLTPKRKKMLLDSLTVKNEVKLHFLFFTYVLTL